MRVSSFFLEFPVAKHVAILVEEQYQVLEVWYPLLRLKEEGIKVVVVGSGTKETYPSKEGYPVKADISADKANPKDFAGVIIPGGWAPDFMRRYPAMVDFVKKVYAQNGVVASICHGGWMLVSADICKGHKATCFFAIKDDMIAAGADYTDAEVVVDRNLITSRKPEDLPHFMQEVIKQLK
jgi:protease I